MGGRQWQVLKRLEESKEIKRKFKRSGVGFRANATKPSRLSNIDLWVVVVKNTKTGLAANTTCSKKNIEATFKDLSTRLLAY